MNNQSVHVTANFRPNSMIYNHNKRVKKFCKREKNIDLSHYHEIIIDSGDVNVFFNKIFEKAVVEYNSNQKRSDRRIKNNDYLSYIKNKNFKSNHRSLKSDGKIKPVTEIEFKIGCRDNQWPNRKQIYKILRLFIKRFEQLYGKSVKIVGAYLHDDEYSISQDKKKNKIFNPPHLHLDIVYIGHSLTNEEIKIEDEDRERIRLEKIEEYKKAGKKWDEKAWKKIDWTDYRVKKFGKSLRNGMSENCSMSAALAELGYRTSAKKQTAQIQFQIDVHKEFQNFCEAMGINVDRTKVESHNHVSPEVLAQINENKKLEIELKKQELQNRHDRKVLDKRNEEIVKKEEVLEISFEKLENENKKLDQTKKTLLKKEKDLESRNTTIENREINITRRENKIQNLEAEVKNNENKIKEKENKIQSCFGLISKLKTSVILWGKDKSLNIQLENKQDKSDDTYDSLSFISSGISKIIGKLKDQVDKFKKRLDTIYSYTPFKLRTLADLMERNNCETLRDYESRFVQNKLDWQQKSKNKRHIGKDKEHEMLR